MSGGILDRLVIRAEESRDVAAVRLVNELAFGGPLEASLVEALRNVDRAISLVAMLDDRVVGHILFTPVAIEHASAATAAAGLAPLAVLPEFQKRGIGSRLTEAGLARCRELGFRTVVVLGHPEYYPRFGFATGATKGLTCEFPSPPDAFMVLELAPGALGGAHGLVRYHPEFSKM